jgi:hypothetical protein
VEMNWYSQRMGGDKGVKKERGPYFPVLMNPRQTQSRTLPPKSQQPLQ